MRHTTALAPLVLLLAGERHGLSLRCLELAVVRDEAVKGLSEQDSLNAIRARVADEAIYEPFAVCTRKPG